MAPRTRKPADEEPVDAEVVEPPEPVDEFEVGDSDPGAPPIDPEDPVAAAARFVASIQQATTEDTTDTISDEVDEVLVGELVEDKPDALAVPEPQSDVHSAIEAAARLAVESPGIAGRDEFLVLAMQARMMAASALVPKALQGKPADCMIVLLTGRDLGIPTTAAVRTVHVIEGTPTLAPKLRLALIRRLGLGDVKKVAGSNCEWAAARAYGPDLVTPLTDEPTVFTWHDAKTQDLVGVECYPSEDGESIEHSEACRTFEKAWKDGVRMKCKDNYRKTPRRMLWWRAAGYEADDAFPEVGMGIYSPDEMGAVTDADGVPLDPATVELPAGFENIDGRGPRTGGGPSSGESSTMCEPEVLAELKLRGNLLPGEVRKQLKERWAVSEQLRGWSLDELPERHLNLVRSMMTGFEAMAKRTGWDPEVAMAEHLAKQGTGPAAGEGDPTAPVVASEALEAPSEGTDPTSAAGASTADVVAT